MLGLADVAQPRRFGVGLRLVALGGYHFAGALGSRQGRGPNGAVGLPHPIHGSPRDRQNQNLEPSSSLNGYGPWAKLLVGT